VKVDVICTESAALLNFGACMTYDNATKTTSLGQCVSFLVKNRSVSTLRNYIQLPENLSELNEYMCTPMNREGLVCSECVDGFGPSVFTYGFQCANCTGAWYGIPIYLLLEFAPITVFYFLILTFQLSATKAPMTSFILYSQLVTLFLESFATFRSSIEYEQGAAMYILFQLVTVFYGVWNLDFARHILPPFCISPHLKQLHIISLFYVSAFYPLFMIGLTWACIEIHSRNFQPFVWLWSKVKKFSTKNRECKGTIVDVFATFLLLSYTKMMQTSLYTLFATYVLNINNEPPIAVVGNDPGVKYFSSMHIPFAILALFILLGPVLLPALLLALYPIRFCRLLLEKCGLGGHTKAALDIFVEKFYSCYRNGLDGKDLRSLASLYFFVRILVFLVIAVQSEVIFFTSLALIFCGTSLFIAIVHPYKKAYMNNLDILILITLSLATILYVLYLYLVPGYARFMSIAMIIIYSLPLIGFCVIVSSNIVNKMSLLKKVKRFLFVHTPNSATVHNQKVNAQDLDSEANVELPDRIIHADAYLNTY
jgi:hypothetical protein